MNDKRYRLYYGENHEDVMIADDKDRVYLRGLQVDRLNTYDIQCRVMADKLEELGYRLIFIRNEYNMDSKKFETSFTTEPKVEDDGEWAVVSIDEFNKVIGK